MAEGPDPVSETIHELEQEVTCGICFDQYKEPKLLPCCHYYCKQCILSISNQYRSNQPFPCPDCREPTLLPGNDPAKLPTAFFINRMKELHLRMESIHTKLETTPKCADHDEPLKIFCYDCRQLICRDCIVIDHAGHKSEFVKKASPDIRKKVMEHLYPLKNLLPDLSTAVSKIKDTKEKIEAEGNLVETKVNATFQELSDILEQCKASILRESRETTEKKMEKLAVQENSLNLSVGCVQSLTKFVERTLEDASVEELIAMHEQVKEVVMQGKQIAIADPVEKPDFGVSVEVSIYEDLKKLCKSNIVLIKEEVDPPKCTVEGDGMRIAEVNSCSGLLLYTNQPEYSSNVKVKVALNSLVDQTSLQLEAAPVKNGVYSIEYIPKVRGRHHLQISVDGQPITGSPFSVLVRIPPTKLDRPVRVIKNINPYYLAINSSNEVIVSDECGDIVILNRKGDVLHSINGSQNGFQKVRGIAVDKDDNIYVSDSINHCVYKFNRRGQFLKWLGREGIEVLESSITHEE